MKNLLCLKRCFGHNENPPVDCPVSFNKEEIKQRVAELPEEIIVKILLRLPLKKTIQFSCVSKKWRSLILHDPQFSKTHYKIASQQRTLGQSLLVSSQIPSRHSAKKLSNPKFQSLQVLAGDHHASKSFLSSPFKKNRRDPEATVQLLGSCNGLVCIRIGRLYLYHENVHIWNPSTGFFRTVLEEKPRRGEHARIPQQKLAREVPHCLLLQRLEENGIIGLAHTGFGYVDATDDYKYVVLATRERLKAAIFSLRTKCWRSIEAPSNIRPRGNWDHPGIYLNEALHWITWDDVKMKTTITVVDLGKEEFREMLLPPDLDRTCFHDENITEVLIRLGDCLSLWRSNSQDIQFWAMREYNVDESWNLLYSFRTADLPANVANRRLRPAFVTESGTFVLNVFRKVHLTDFGRESFFIRIECHEEKKPVCKHIFEEFRTYLVSCKAIQYDQTLLSA